ncbi:thiamine-phosphate pyrophosphorylase [Tamlana nanhaiensis]|uniref:Thiamine-phosphate synthase n=1 Tax=Neotamlana nanhaiensis TaxID=1382798 RepID=A0A0D7W3U6_9FLAO|nr:thiamine phosphate synthase [Tamlana nanhaiensis]KJD33378.1 thiamine-phosphate pyrophosphorylase [Tamlana nanhaiensis]
MKTIDYRLMYVTDDRIEDDATFFNILEASLKGGATIVQLREKQRSTKAFYHRAKRAKSLCELYNVPLIINDRLDIALAVDADGVHLGQNDMPIGIARKLLGETKIIGLSVSNNQQAEDSNQLPIDYIGISPIFSTNTKTEDLDKPLSISGLQSIRKISSKPIVCIGGIDKNNTKEIMQNGADGIAVVSAISKAENPEVATQFLKQLL